MSLLAIMRRDLRKYGLTVEQYQQLLKEQGGVCKICRLPPAARRLAVDHDHDTKVIRGLLCVSCNRGLGMFRDNPNLLSEAKSYLEAAR